MNRFMIVFGLLLLTWVSAAAETVVVGPYLHSSRVIELVLLQKGKPAPGIQVEFYQYVEGKEARFWVGLTDEHGRLLSPMLGEGGLYKISAETDTRRAELYIEVSEREKSPTPVQMKLARRDGLEVAEEAAASAWVKDFQGTVFDQSGAVIPGAEVEVFRKDDLDNAPLAKTQTGQKGDFAVHLANGTYVARVRSQGFKTYVLVFEVSEKGQLDLHITLEVGSIA